MNTIYQIIGVLGTILTPIGSIVMFYFMFREKRNKIMLEDVETRIRIKKAKLEEIELDKETKRKLNESN